MILVIQTRDIITRRYLIDVMHQSFFNNQHKNSDFRFYDPQAYKNYVLIIYHNREKIMSFLVTDFRQNNQAFYCVFGRGNNESNKDV